MKKGEMQSITAIEAGVDKIPPRPLLVGNRPYEVTELCEAIKREVLEFYQQTQETVFSRSRKRECVMPRQVMHYLAYSLTGLSLKQIGAIYPSKKTMDHTTVIHSCVTITNLIHQNRDFRNEIFYIYERLQGINPEPVSPPWSKPEKAVYVKPLPKVRDQFMSESEKVVQKYL
jgi:hypothetical protein